jgi:hypothetical protein
MKIGDNVKAQIRLTPHYGLWLTLGDIEILCDVGDDQPELDGYQVGDLVTVEILRINGEAISGRVVGLGIND